MKYAIVFLLMIWLTSCDFDTPRSILKAPNNLSTEQIDSVLNKFNFEYETPIVIKNSDMVLMPISTNLLDGKRLRSKDGYYSKEYSRYWNVVCYNTKTDEIKLLSEAKLRISEIYATLNDYIDQKKILANHVLYEIADTDFNEDGILDHKDPNQLFASDYSGERLQRVSPANEHLEYFEVIENTNQIMLRTIRDVDNDQRFTLNDESIWYKAELKDSTWVNIEIIDIDGIEKIKRLYFDKWLSQHDDKNK